MFPIVCNYDTDKIEETIQINFFNNTTPIQLNETIYNQIYIVTKDTIHTIDDIFLKTYFLDDIKEAIQQCCNTDMYQCFIKNEKINMGFLWDIKNIIIEFYSKNNYEFTKSIYKSKKLIITGINYILKLNKKEKECLKYFKIHVTFDKIPKCKCLLLRDYKKL